MGYIKTVWNEKSVPGISGAKLNKIEQGIYEAHERIANMQEIPSGGTSADAALYDINIGFDGTNHGAPGDSVRAQAQQLDDKINEVSGQLSSEIGEINSNVKDITSTIGVVFDWKSMGNTDNPTGWRKGYYGASDGVYATSNYHICTNGSIKGDFTDSDYPTIYPPQGYYVVVFEYSTSDTSGFVKRIVGEVDEPIEFAINHEYYYTFNISRFDNADSSSYLTDEFTSSCVMYAIDHSRLGAIEKEVAKLGEPKYSIKCDNLKTTNFKQGYYGQANGEYTSGNTYLCSKEPYRFYGDIVVITPAPEYGLAISEYDADGNYIKSTGSAKDYIGVPRSMKLTEGCYYHITLGKFPTESSNYLTDEVLSTYDIKVRSDFVTDKKPCYQLNNMYFNVEVDRPLAFGGEEVLDYKETIECVVRLPKKYSVDGKKTRLIFMAHGGSGYIKSSTDTWYNENWKGLVDFLVSNGYAVFDCNIFGGTSVSLIGKANGSPLYINVVKQAYDYIVENYNIHSQIFVHGTSMGGVGASGFAKAYPSLVLAESSFAGRDLIDYIYRVYSNEGMDADTAQSFALSYDYDNITALTDDKFSHAVGSQFSLSLSKIDNGSLIPAPDRVTDYNAWMKYFNDIFNAERNEDIGVFIGQRSVPYKAWNSWADRPKATKLEETLQKAYTIGSACVYEVVNYEEGSHTAMSYGMINNMREQLLAWYKRWD